MKWDFDLCLGCKIDKLLSLRWRIPKLLDKIKCEFEMKTTKDQGVEDTFFGLQHFGG